MSHQPRSHAGDLSEQIGWLDLCGLSQRRIQAGVFLDVIDAMKKESQRISGRTLIVIGLELAVSMCLSAA